MKSFFAGRLAGLAPERLLIQPHNHGTAPAIAYGLTHLHRINSAAVLDLFPSDHHFANEGAFATYTDLVFAQAERHPERVVLLGVTPDSPEEAYGWIEPGTALPNSPAFEVRCFWEKPSRKAAARLMRRRTLPDLVRSFE